MKYVVMILACLTLAAVGCGEVVTVRPVVKKIATKKVEQAVEKAVEKATEKIVAKPKKKKAKPRVPVIWAPAPPKTPDQCPDGKCPYGEVIFDGATFWEVPGANLPLELRQKNWGGGSCVFASTVYDLRWHGEYEKANWLRNNYSGGSGIDRLSAALDRGQVRYAYTSSGDISFLHWCVRTRRPAMVFYYSNHAVTFCGITDGYVYLLDNNRIKSYQVIPEQEFYRKWKGYGGTALAILDGSPAPPLPWKVM